MVDLDVVDEENKIAFPDVMFFLEESGSYYLPSSKTNEFNSLLFDDNLLQSVGQDVDNQFSIAADIDGDGSTDLLSLVDQGAKYYRNKGFGTFELSYEFSEGGISHFPSAPKHAVIFDFDQDGDLDLAISAYNSTSFGEAVVLIFKNTGSGIFESPGKLDYPFKTPSFLVGMDVDGDHDLDLVVSEQVEGQVLCFENDGSAEFVFKSIIAENLNEPRCLHSFNAESNGDYDPLDPFGKRDLLIGSQNNISVAENDGSGNFSTSTALDNLGGFVRSVKPLRLNSDSLSDLVYLLDQQGVYFALQGDDGFSQGKSINDDISKPQSLEVYHYQDQETNAIKPILLVGVPSSDSSTEPKIYQFSPPVFVETDTSWRFHEKFELKLSGINGSISGMQVVDLDRAYNFYEFELAPELDFEAFNGQKIKSEGRLFFETAPDFENPLSGTDNLYKVNVYFNKKGEPSGRQKKLVQVLVEDTLEKAKIHSFAEFQNDLFLHNENFLVVWDELNASNPESDYETLRYTLLESDLNDGHFFDINSSTGKLSFKKSMRFEERSNPDGSFNDLNLLVGVQEFQGHLTDFSTLPYSDKRAFSIRLNDGFEPPQIQNPDLFFTAKEDGDSLQIPLSDFNVSDDPSNQSPGISQISIFHYPDFGDASLTPQEDLNQGITPDTLHYKPDKDYSGNDKVKITIEFINHLGLSAFGNMVIEIEPQQDRPVPLTPTDILHREGDKNITELKGSDPDPNDKNSLSWRLFDPEDPNFVINGKTLLFKNTPDYETDKDTIFIADLVLSDGEHNVSHNILIQLLDIPDTLPNSILSATQTNLFRIYEREFEVVDLKLFDEDGPQDPSAIVVGGADERFFTIINGKLRVKEQYSLNRNTPEDSNLDNLYELKIFITDGLDSATYQVFVKVEDVDENAPVFIDLPKNQTPDGDPIFKVFENNTEIGTLIAEDQEGKVLSYAIVGGENKDLFNLHSSSGVLSFISPPNFEEIALEIDGKFMEPIFLVEVEVTDGIFLTRQNIAVQVADSNDLPFLVTRQFITLEDTGLFENLDPSDEDGSDDSISLQIHSQPSNGLVKLYEREKSFEYIPSANFYGSESFEILLKDNLLGERIETIEVMINSVNDPPVAQNDFNYYFSKDSNDSIPLEFSVLENDNSGPDPRTEMVNYTIQITKPIEAGILQESSEVGSYSFFINDTNTLGELDFSYAIIDKDLNASAEAIIWVASLAKLPNWMSLKNFGLFYIQSEESEDTWIYHTQMGWVYVSDFEKNIQRNLDLARVDRVVLDGGLVC